MAVLNTVLHPPGTGCCNVFLLFLHLCLNFTKPSVQRAILRLYGNINYCFCCVKYRSFCTKQIPGFTCGEKYWAESRVYIVITPLSVFSQVTPWKRRLLKKPSLRQWYKCVKNFKKIPIQSIYSSVTEIVQCSYRLGLFGGHILLFFLFQLRLVDKFVWMCAVSTQMS